MQINHIGLSALLAMASMLAAANDTQLGEVRVTSSTIDDRFAGKKGEPSSTHEISGKTIDDKRPENMIEMLRAIPGVTADLSSGDEIKIKLRGIENQRYMGEKPGVAIVIDGVPVFERTGKVNVDLDNIESIKVIKGGASYLFGEDALSGAIIITTKRGAKYKGVTFATDVGSWDYNRQLVRAGFATDWGTGHLQASHRAGDDYYFQSAYETNYIDGNLRLFLTDTSDLTFGFEKSDRAKDKHGSVKGARQAAVDPTGVIGRDYSRKYDVALDKFNLTYSNDYAAGSNFMLTGYEYRDRTVFWSAPQTLLANGTMITSASPGYYEAYQTLNNYRQVQRGAKGEWRSTADKFGWLGGVDIRRNRYQNKNVAGVDYCKRTNTVGCAFDPPGPAPAVNQGVLAGTVMTDDLTDEAINAIYGELKFKASERWLLSVNARHDNLGLDYHGKPGSENDGVAVDKSKTFNVNSWRLGANYAAAANLDFFGNLATGFRTPSVEQLYRGSISPSSGKTASNEDLRPERSLNYEVGTRAKTSAFGVAMDIEAALFQIDRKNFILASTGQYAGSSTGDIEKYENIGGVRNRGLELAVRSDPNRLFSFDAAYTYLKADFTKYDKFNLILGNQYAGFNASCAAIVDFDKSHCLVPYNNTGRAVPRVPRHMLNLTGHWQAAERLRLSLEMDAKSWSYADEINQERLRGMTLFHLGANYDVKESGFLGVKWSLFARVNNLFDKKYRVSSRGTNDTKSNLAPEKYDGVYNSQDPSIIVGKPRHWLAGVTASF